MLNDCSMCELALVVPKLQERCHRNERDIMMVLARVEKMCDNLTAKIDGQSECLADVQRQIRQLVEGEKDEP